ncbi:hypothetical protein JCM10914A_43240 [Paenibacillus sp. JCM 10914]
MRSQKTPEGVSIITCTNRPEFFDHLIENFRRQNYKHKELIMLMIIIQEKRWLNDPHSTIIETDWHNRKNAAIL